MAKNKFNKLYGWGFLAILLCGLILVNVIGSLSNQRLDMTKDQRYSLNQSTVDFLKDKSNFKNRLNITIYLGDKLPSQLRYFKTSLIEKLKEFKTIAGDRIEYQIINPFPKEATEGENNEMRNELFAEGKGIVPMNINYRHNAQNINLEVFPGAIISYGGSDVQFLQLLPGTRGQQVVSLQQLEKYVQNAVQNLEYMLISTIRRTTQEYKPRIAFLQGHGELEYKNTQRARAVISPYYSIKDVHLSDSLHPKGNIDALKNFDGLIIARPTQKFSNEHLYIIDQFLMRGGRLMCFVDQLHFKMDTLLRNGQTHTTRYNTGLGKMLFDYGLKINDNYVIDAQCAPLPVRISRDKLMPWFFHVLATPTDHPIARSVQPVSLEYVNEVQFVGGSKDIVQFPVLTSSTNATVTGLAPLINLRMPLNYGDNPKLIPYPNREENKKCLAGLTEGMYESHFKSRLVDNFGKNPDAKFLEKSEKEGKVLVVGNGRFLENQYDSMPSRRTSEFLYRPKQQINDLLYNEQLARIGYQHFFGNQDFIQNAVDYMMGDNSVIELRSRQVEIRKIDENKVKQMANTLKFVNVVVPVLLIIGMGILLGFIRKRRYKK